MPIRDLMVTRLAKEILGPRNGPFERICGRDGKTPPEPSDEYVVGVLEPKGIKRSPISHFGSTGIVSSQVVNRMDDDDKSPDEEEDYDYGTAPAEITPELDPRALPKSVGLSFVVKADSSPIISFCATWARYRKNENCWERTPFSLIKRQISVRSDATWQPDQDSGVMLYMRQVPVSEGTHISLFLVNSTPSFNQHPKVEELVFQPQIRVICDDGTKVLPIREPEKKQDPDALNLLYKHRYAMARGHLCGATWYEVDPERTPWPKNPEEIGPPFYWIDGEILSPSDRQLFTRPDVRTEYLPCYPVEQASLSGPSKENLPLLIAEDLADLWRSKQLTGSLKPIVESYGRWINEQKKAVSLLSGSEQAIALNNIDKCEYSMNRMNNALSLIDQDNDVRLAFCFMNKVMHQQSIWKDPSKPLKWHLFQIAFILQCIPGIFNEESIDRSICDLLWFPTGAGKTEAYLGLAAFSIALRRRKVKNGVAASAGVSVLSRYTLRLLTIQQFRRALNMITACEYLRTISWLPRGLETEKNPWGLSRFSIGLWVGAGVTPNHLLDWPIYDRAKDQPKMILGAIGELFGRQRLRNSIAEHIEGDQSEPAQVLTCPACKSILAISSTTLTPGYHKVHWIVSSVTYPNVSIMPKLASFRGLVIDNVEVTPLPNGSTFIISVQFRVSEGSEINPTLIDSWWDEVIKPALGPNCNAEFVRPSRPGYFFRRYDLAQKPIDFEIHCPNPSCDLNKVIWAESILAKEVALKVPVLPAFALPQSSFNSWGMPIPAYTVDDQIYGRCPSMVVGTVDKFARLCFEPRAAALFGNVTHFDTKWGYYRSNVPPQIDDSMGKSYEVFGFDPPSLIIQDELHLIEGPLGTMVGLFETGIDLLASQHKNGKMFGPKYIASTATIKQADSQVQALFCRKLAQFPPMGLSIDDSFFALSREPHPLDSAASGRLYLGVCAPGRGAQTPIIRIWSSLLRESDEIRSQRPSSDREADQFCTIVGYFNAKRELAGAVGLYKQDIPERLGVLAERYGVDKYGPFQHIELSGRTESVDIPGNLDRLAKFPNNDVNALFCTSMFGTGVDVDRLGLMVVHGQPKTTANYIQATGRVGRKMGGLVITFLRSTRPRDLDHYEFFVGYHRSLHRYVEPITVFPFSPRARERGLGPLSVFVLRNGREILGIPISSLWGFESRPKKGVVAISGSRNMGTFRRSPEVQAIIEAFESRSQSQPVERNPGNNICKLEIMAELDRWEAFALKLQKLVYSESTMTKIPALPVVLGDPSHFERGLPEVFKNAPQSLREVEGTTTFDDEA